LEIASRINQGFAHHNYSHQVVSPRIFLISVIFLVCCQPPR